MRFAPLRRFPPLRSAPLGRGFAPLGALLALSACGGGGGGGNTMVITLCNLGCNQTSGAFDCGPFTVEVFENQAIVVEFSEPIDIDSVDKNTFQVEDASGVAPFGEYKLGASPNEVIFRPVTTFGPSGEPDFGFEEGETYTIVIPGRTQDPSGPWIESTSGAANAIRMECTVKASKGVQDVVSGPPRVDLVVRRVTAYTGNDPTLAPSAFADEIANAGTELSTVWRETDINFVFDDLMNPVSLVSNPVSGVSQTISVLFDPDGNVADPSDQVALFGKFLPPILDTDTNTTSLVFRLSKGLPSAGGVPFLPGTPVPPGKRRVVVVMQGGQSGIRDLADNPLLNAGVVTFVPEVISFVPVVLPKHPSGLGERFLSTSTNQADADTAGGMWGATELVSGGPANSIGLLASGPASAVPGQYLRAPGGSGRLGRLVVEAGQTLTLGTDGALEATIGDIPIAAPDSPFFVLQKLPSSEIIEVPVAAVGRVVWDQLQIFGREPDWEDLGRPGPPTMEVQIEAQDPARPGEFAPVWIGNDGVTPMTMDVEVATYTDTYIVDNYDRGAGDLPGTGSYSASADFAGDGFGAAGVGAAGVFEFSSVLLQSGSRLAFTGSSPARLFGRGDLEIRGVLDVAGQDAGAHQSHLRLGATGALAGPGGGDGGRGGDRYDHAQPAYQFLSFTALPIPGTIFSADALSANYFGIDSVDDFELDGTIGSGIGGLPGAGLGGGPGSVHWPTLFPGEADATTYTGLVTTLGDIKFDFILCRSPQLSAPGGGGGYTPGAWGTSTNGGIGVPKTSHSGIFADSSNPIPPLPPNTQRGDTAGIVFEDLNPDTGDLIGGSGGGGAGTHIRNSKTNGAAFNNCFLVALGQPPPLKIMEFSDHSGAAGGGGGGAVQVQAGRLLTLNGIIDATGGRGGSLFQGGGTFDDYQRQSMPGGGGSGGAILAQGATIQVASLSGRANVLGGLGGIGGFLSVGGDGGAGRVRFEVPDYSIQDVDLLRDNAVQNDTVTPGDSEFPGVYPAELVTAGIMVRPDQGPGAFSGAQSCWMQPDGNFFQVDFQADAGPSLGWDMNVIFSNGQVSSYRAPLATGPLAGLSVEEVFGSRLRDPDATADLFNSSPIVVRFQGARAIEALPDPCNVNIEGTAVLQGSVTPWVYHPAELNDYWAQVPGVSSAQAVQRRPNMIRFQVILDEAHPFAFVVAGITNLRVFALPD